jgi:two-component system CheB/CheR fusion protein
VIRAKQQKVQFWDKLLTNAARDSISSLEDELRFTRENLQATIQELESSNEELQATNEETVASNEELQSTNEELQSVNEELHTVNAEYHRKIGQLRDLNDDMDNLLRSSDVAVLFLDENLNIRRFTPKLGELFHLRAQDIGRPMRDFRSGLVPDTLIHTLREVMHSRQAALEELETADGSVYLIRVTPFDSASLSDGVVVNYTDTTLVREREDTAKRWASIVESTADCIVAIDLSREITQWNTAAAETYGFTSEEAVGQNFFDLVVPTESRDENAVKIEQVRSEETATEFQTKRTKKNGNTVDVSVRLSPVVGTAGIVGISSIERDITQQLRISRLRQFEDAVQTGRFSNEPVPTCWQDLDRLSQDIGVQCVWIWQVDPLSNKLKETYTGFGKYEDEWLGENDLDFSKLIETALSSGGTIRRKVTKSAAWKELEAAESRGKKNVNQQLKPDKEMWQLVLLPLRGHGSAIGVAGFLIDAQDADELKEIDRSLNSIADSLGARIGEQSRYDSLVRISEIVENASDFIATADASGNLVSLNRAARLLTGIGLEEDPRGQRLTRFFAANSVKKIVSEGIPEATRTGTWTGETEIVDRNSNAIPVSQLITAHRDGQGELQYISTICRIIAEQKNVQQRLSELIHETATANEAKTTFLANISHDVRTPMTTVIGMADLLLDQNLNNEQTSMLETIRSSGRHVTALLNDLLDLSKVESGQLAIKPAPASLKDIVDDVLGAYRPIFNVQGLRLTDDVSGLPEQTFMFDSVRLRQIADNLLSNALKFTTDGHVALTAKVTDGEFILEVADTGCGIEQSLLPSVFDPYTQSSPTSSRRVRGAGLGLAISRKLALMMGGALDVESVAGEGSCFTLCIPVELSSDDTNTQSADPLFPSSDRPLEGKRILVAEDTVGIQFLVRRILEREGMQVTVVGDGKAAVDSATGDAKRSEFDAILLDMQMPIMDGYQAAKRFRKSGLAIPIIAFTASTMPDEQVASLDAGCDAFIPKPIDRERLLMTLFEQIKQND